MVPSPDPPDPSEHSDASEASDASGRSEPSEAGDARDALRGLEERLERASAAAERLISDAGSYASRVTGRPPPAGWQAPSDDGQDGAPRELELLTSVLRSLRDLVPAELEHRVAEALRELLLAIRALIDWYVERLDRVRREPAEVQDIPIV